MMGLLAIIGVILLAAILIPWPHRRPDAWSPYDARDVEMLARELAEACDVRAWDTLEDHEQDVYEGRARRLLTVFEMRAR